MRPQACTYTYIGLFGSLSPKPLPPNPKPYNTYIELVGSLGTRLQDQLLLRRPHGQSIWLQSGALPALAGFVGLGLVVGFGV